MITFCSNCYNRLWQLQKTLPQNLEYTEVNRISIFILAYNDTSVKPYLTEYFKDYLEDGRLSVLEHEDSRPYSFGHVKSLSHSLAPGDILFNLDADNFIEGTLPRLQNLKDDEIMISRLYLKDGRGGRIGVTRKTFEELGGYLDNQSLFDDDDFKYRAQKLGKKVVLEDCPKAPLKNERN